jgi:hypothetical protein
VIVEMTDFEALAARELEAAAGAKTLEDKRKNLDQAAVYAAEAEAARQVESADP